MQEFLLILKGDGMDGLAPEELQRLLANYKGWVQELGDQYLAGQRLQSSGALIRDQENILTDGPFLEPKEIIAGYFLIRALDLEAAIAIAQSSPHAPYYQIEVRPLVQPLMH